VSELRLAAGDSLITPAALAKRLSDASLGAALPRFLAALDAAQERFRHGDLRAMEDALAAMPALPRAAMPASAPVVRIGDPALLDADVRTSLHDALQRLHPWRKGPFALFGIDIDSEWRSDLKWARVESAISPLAGRCVLDVGCGNGYYLWRMLGLGARFALGVDPSLRSIAQFTAIARAVQSAPVALLPLASEELPPDTQAFDTVFSMGVLYHRRDPLAHLEELRGQLGPGGELVLETLVVEGGAGDVLEPRGRYAKMRNVWCIPSADTLLGWLRAGGFTDARIADTSITTPLEQRRTPWMRFESLADFLDPTDPSRTVEGHPAPRRALVVATRRP
jgi:tRNA (mo5U34)-methyltransferase